MGLKCAVLAIAVAGRFSLFAQKQNNYVASKVTGQLALTRIVNPLLGANRSLAALVGGAPAPETSKVPTRFPHPPFPRLLGAATSIAMPPIQSLPISRSGGFGFDGLSHYDQRQANSGNQFSVEPPNPSIA